MARVTVEDCVVKVPNRFKLVLLAAQRAREITSGAPLTVDRDDDKYPVVALREIADETIGLAHLEDSLVRGMQKHVEIDEPEETHELEVDPLSFAVAPLAASSEDEDLAAGLDGDEEGDAEEGDAEDEAALDEEVAEDDLADEIDLPETPSDAADEDLDLADTTPPEAADDLDEEI